MAKSYQSSNYGNSSSSSSNNDSSRRAKSRKGSAALQATVANVQQKTGTAEAESKSSSSKISDKQRQRVLEQHANTPRGHFEGHKSPDVERLPEAERKEASRSRKRRSMQFSEVTIKKPRAYLNYEKEQARREFIKKTGAPITARREEQARREAYNNRTPTTMERVFPSLKPAYDDPYRTKFTKSYAQGFGTSLIAGAALGAGAGATGVVGVGTLAAAPAISTGAIIAGLAYGSYKTAQVQYRTAKAAAEGYKSDGFKGAFTGMKDFHDDRTTQFWQKVDENPEKTGAIIGGVTGGALGYMSGASYEKEFMLSTAKSVSFKPSKAHRTGDVKYPKTRQTSTSEVQIGNQKYKVKNVLRAKEEVYSDKVIGRGTIKHDIYSGSTKTGSAQTKFAKVSKPTDTGSKFEIGSKTTYKGKSEIYKTEGRLTKVLEVPGGAGSTSTSKNYFQLHKPSSQVGYNLKGTTFKYNQGQFTKTSGVAGYVERTRGVTSTKYYKGSMNSKTTLKEDWMGTQISGSVKPAKAKTPTPKILLDKKGSLSVSRPGAGYGTSTFAPTSRTITTPELSSVLQKTPPLTFKALESSSLEAAKMTFMGQINTAGIAGGSLLGSFAAGKAAAIPKTVIHSKSSPAYKSITEPSVIQIIQPQTAFKPVTDTIPQSSSIPAPRMDFSFMSTPGTPTPSQPTVIIPNTPLFPFLGAPFFPDLDLFGGGSRPGVTKKQRKKYKISLGAATFNIKGKRPQRMTGFGIRPIPL